MTERSTSTSPTSAARVTVSVFGVVAALAGFEHGVGALLQGSVPPPGLVFESWPDAPAYEVLSGEPAMTVVPNLRISGVLTIAVSLAFAAWSIQFVGSRRGGVVLIGLSLLLLLVGGGFGPPLLGVVLGVAATRIGTGWRWLEQTVSRRGRSTLSNLWPYSLVLGVLGWLALWPGVPILHYAFGFADWRLVAVLTPLSFMLLVLAIVAGFARDSVHPTDRTGEHASRAG